MNEKDVHDFEKLENLYNEMVSTPNQEVVEEGIVNRVVQGGKSYGQAAGKYVGGIGRALVGKGSPSVGIFRTYYKIVNLVKGYVSDIDSTAGAKVTTDSAKVDLLWFTLQDVAKGTGVEAERAKKIVTAMQAKMKGIRGGRGSIPSIDDFTKILTSLGNI